jgi:phospholipase C
MMENHSFDNYLGTLGKGDGLPDPRPGNVTMGGDVIAALRLASPTQPEFGMCEHRPVD